MEHHKYDVLKIQNQLCFPLYVCAKETIRLYKPFLDELELTYTQYITMMVLWEKRSVTVKEMGEQLFLDSGTLTPLLKKLETKGYISRTRSTADERNLIVTITDEGDALKDKAIEIPKHMAENLVIQGNELIDFYNTLYKLLGHPEIRVERIEE